MLGSLPTDDLRNLARHQIETLERWLRRFIHDALVAHFGGSLAALPIKRDIVDQASARRSQQPTRYPRDVDALLFDDLVTILCHPQLYAPYFKHGLNQAFPDGISEARTFLSRIVEARNPLSHSNEITHHQALRVACYSTDIIASLKARYAGLNLSQTYNAPSFLRVWDDRGNSAEIDQTEGCNFQFRETELRPGDILDLEVQPDGSFDDGSYRIVWQVCNIARGESGAGPRFSLTIQDYHVNQNGLVIRGTIVSDKSWHRHGAHDAMFHVYYSVLPPI